MTKDDFKRAYPKADDDSGWAADELDASVMVGHGFEVDEMLRVCEFWQMREEPITLGLEADSGDVIDVTEMADAERAMLLAVGDDGQLVIRETVKPYAECYVLTSKQVLEGPYRLDIPRLPVFRVEDIGPTSYRLFYASERVGLAPMVVGLVKGLARRCVAEGLPRLQWWVLDWNEPALGFYRSIGAEPMDEWTVQRVSGAALETLAVVAYQQPVSRARASASA